MKKLSIAIFLLFLFGCATLPPPPGQTSKAGYIGDYDASHLGEIIVTVPSGDKKSELRNLHLSLSALINPKEPSISSSYNVSSIVQRFNSRLSSIIVREILKYNKITANDLASLSDKVVKMAQNEFNKMFSEWTHSDKFDVEIVLTSIFFTDGSVGRGSRYRW